MSSLLGSMYTGNSGIQVNGIGVSVVGDNIANTNTTGFKASRAHFQETFSQMMVNTRGSDQLGKGATLQRIEKMFSAGSFKATGVPTDMAINGDGFFITNDPQQPGANMYTRAGAFRFDNENYLVDPGGNRVQGFSAGTDGTVNTALGDIQLDASMMPPSATTTVEMQANLNPEPSEAGQPPDTFRQGMTIYDSTGVSRQVTAVFTPNAGNAGQWDVTLEVPTSDLAAPADPNAEFESINVGSITFNDSGRLDQQNLNNPVAIGWNNAAAGAVSFDFGDDIQGGGTGASGVTQYALQPSQLSDLQTDGNAPGSLDGVIIDDQGRINMAYTNGETRIAGQVALARFNDPTELVSVGGNGFIASPASGEAVVGNPGTGGRGAVQSGALEMSNVELSEQFVDLIAFQRGYQGNARTITTADNLLQEVIQLVR
ncbi:MAG: flagellar hook protein FlgE [Bradymonadia bacterium]